MTDYRYSTISTMTNDTARKSNGSTISSASLTQVSDISDEPRTTEKANATGSSQTSVKDTTASGQISTTDVIVEVASDTDGNKLPPLLIPPTTHKSMSSSEDDSPPPLPSSEPPALDEDTFKFQSGKTPTSYRMAGNFHGAQIFMGFKFLWILCALLIHKNY